jgi:hypothetical protein
MDQLITLINDYGLQFVLGAVGLGIIGTGMGTTAGVLGYRHGPDITRGAWIGMILMLVIRVFAAALASKTGAHIQ